jgi:hypothetical protein
VDVTASRLLTAVVAERCEVAVHGRTTTAPYGRSTSRYARAVAAAVVATAALVAAANAIPAHTTQERPASSAAQGQVRGG